MAHWILKDVCCEESYECPFCHARFGYQGNPGCDRWKVCPKCGKWVGGNGNNAPD